MAVLGPVAPYRDPPRRPSRWSAEGRAVRGRRLERDTQQDQLRMELQLDQYLSEVKNFKNQFSDQSECICLSVFISLLLYVCRVR